VSTASSIAQKVTAEDREVIKGILARLVHTPHRVEWGQGDWPIVRQLTKRLASYRPITTCMGCHLKAINILREAVDMPPIGGEASESLRTRRLAICRGVAPDHSDACPAYHATTDSCGRLAVDALAPEPVMMEDGRMITPCGCNVGVKSTEIVNDVAVFVFGKAAHKFFQCPANKWPTR
jgi:hypothetical protein